MAEIAIKAFDGHFISDAKSSKKYDILTGYDDGHQWQRLVCLEKFLIVRILGKTIDEISHYFEPEMDGETIVKMFRYKYNFDEKMSAEELNEIRNNTQSWLIKNIIETDIEDKIGV